MSVPTAVGYLNPLQGRSGSLIAGKQNGRLTVR